MQLSKGSAFNSKYKGPEVVYIPDDFKKQHEDSRAGAE